jgi:hypothetical protein
MADKAVLRFVKRSMNDSFDPQRFVDAQILSSEMPRTAHKVSNSALLRGSPRPIHLVRHAVARGATQPNPLLLSPR